MVHRRRGENQVPFRAIPKWILFQICVFVFQIFILSFCSQREDIMRSAWGEAVSENSIEAYNAFMNNYPQSPFVQEAQSNIQKLQFEKAKAVNNIAAYEKYLKIYPEGPLANEAKRRIVEFSKGWLPVLKEARVIKLLIQKTLPEFIDFPIADLLSSLLRTVGLDSEIVSRDDGNLIFNIQISGEPLAARYSLVTRRNWFSPPSSTIDVGNVYTGAKVWGAISFVNNKKPLLEKRFYGEVSPPVSTTDSTTDIVRENQIQYRTVRLNFFDAYSKPGSYLHRLIEMMGEIFGPYGLVAGLKYEDDGISFHHLIESYAKEELVKAGRPAVETLILALSDNSLNLENRVANVLGQIGDPRAIEPLIETLKKGTGLIEVARALEKLTGKSYGIDYQNWTSWWQLHKEEFLNKKN